MPPVSSSCDEPWVLRTAVTDDADAIADIYNRHIDIGGATFDSVHWTADQAARRLSQPLPDGWYVADAHSRILGWASVRRYSDRFGYRFTCESAIYLDPTAIGKGIGGPLQEMVDRHCRKHDIHHAVARIIADNERSIAFHQRFGYEPVGVQREIGRIDGRWVDVAILQKSSRVLSVQIGPVRT